MVTYITAELVTMFNAPNLKKKPLRLYSKFDIKKKLYAPVIFRNGWPDGHDTYLKPFCENLILTIYSVPYKALKIYLDLTDMPVTGNSCGGCIIASVKSFDVSYQVALSERSELSILH